MLHRCRSKRRDGATYVCFATTPRSSREPRRSFFLSMLIDYASRFHHFVVKIFKSQYTKDGGLSNARAILQKKKIMQVPYSREIVDLLNYKRDIEVSRICDTFKRFRFLILTLLRFWNSDLLLTLLNEKDL